MIEEKKLRNENLDFTKYVLTLLLVLYHVPATGEDGIYIISLFIKNLGDCVVSAFALISGYLFWKGVNNFTVVRSKMRKRMWTLLVPYVVWNLINTIYLNASAVGFKNISRDVFTINLFENVFLWKSSPHFWYVFMLLFWTFFAPALYLCYRNIFLSSLLLISQIVYFCYKGPNILDSRVVFCAYTWGGLVASQNCKFLWDFVKEHIHLLFYLSIIFYMMTGILVAYIGPIDMNIMVWITFLRALSIILILYRLASKTRRSKFCIYSFWIYAIHYHLDKSIGFGLHTYIDGIIWQLITFGLTSVVALTSGCIMKKYFSGLYKVLTGSR